MKKFMTKTAFWNLILKKSITIQFFLMLNTLIIQVFQIKKDYHYKNKATIWSMQKKYTVVRYLK